jgi:hypothetical protein
VPADAEVGWTQLTDVSQAGLPEADEVREYTFEEADAATLAELGLEQPAEEATPAPPVEAPKPARARTRRPSAGTAKAANGDASEAPKARGGRARRIGVDRSGQAPDAIPRQAGHVGRFSRDARGRGRGDLAALPLRAHQGAVDRLWMQKGRPVGRPSRVAARGQSA